MSTQQVDNAFRTLAEQEFANLTTFRKSGVGVPTPVWFALDGDLVYISTGTEAGKVKRVRSTPSVTLAACDRTGNPLGPTVRGTARVLTGDDAQVAEQALQAKYGLRRKAFMLARGMASRESAYIEVQPAGE